jgi:hypothetical protein
MQSVGMKIVEELSVCDLRYIAYNLFEVNMEDGEELTVGQVAQIASMTPKEILESWLYYQGVIDYTDSICEFMKFLGWKEPE